MKNSEPRIVINGIVLDEGQSMTVRVAISNFQTDLADPEIDLGEMREPYQKRVSEIQKIIFWNR